ncbi:MAG: glycine radical domain-containing protein [Desulfobacterales bacterium]
MTADLYPNLLIRVSGYSAYFNDLSPQMKEEVISRSLNAAQEFIKIS